MARRFERHPGPRAFFAATQAALDAVILADTDGLIVHLNPAAQAMFGIGPDDGLGRPLTILMPERYRDQHTFGLRRFRRTREPRVIGRTVELAGLRADGT